MKRRDAIAGDCACRAGVARLQQKYKITHLDCELPSHVDQGIIGLMDRRTGRSCTNRVLAQQAQHSRKTETI